MQDRHLCCPPAFLLGPAVPPHFFHSRIATVGNISFCKISSIFDL